MPFGLADLGILVLGIVVGFVLGTALRHIATRTATVTGTIVVTMLNFSATLLKNSPKFLPILGWGIFLGMFVSLIADINQNNKTPTKNL